MQEKIFFFDIVLHVLINFGQIENFNKFVLFPLQEAINKRVLFWNEPNYDPGAIETLKMLFGGDTCNVKVKYKNDATIRRTPIIVLSNVDVLPTNDAFRWHVGPVDFPIPQQFHSHIRGFIALELLKMLTKEELVITKLEDMNIKTTVTIQRSNPYAQVSLVSLKPQRVFNKDSD